MKPEKKHELTTQEYEEKLRKPHGESVAAGSLAGAAAGAVAGAVVGPIGAVVGGMIGAAVGAGAGEIIAEEGERVSKHDRELDDEIGVTSGDLGAADPNMPPAKRGVFSAASAGAGGGGGGSAEGPMQNVDE